MSLNLPNKDARLTARPVEGLGIRNDVTGRATFLVGWTEPRIRTSGYWKSSLGVPDVKISPIISALRGWARR
jgi:hypothetical protein